MEIPSSIPNLEVKHFIADNTAGSPCRKRKSLPALSFFTYYTGFYPISVLHWARVRAFFFRSFFRGQRSGFSIQLFSTFSLYIWILNAELCVLTSYSSVVIHFFYCFDIMTITIQIQYIFMNDYYCATMEVWENCKYICSFKKGMYRWKRWLL